MRDNVVGSGAKKAGRGMLIGMKENADEKGVEGEGGMPRAPSLAAACLVTLRIFGRGWVGFNSCRGLVESGDRRG